MSEEEYYKNYILAILTFVVILTFPSNSPNIFYIFASYEMHVRNKYDVYSMKSIAAMVCVWEKEGL